MELAKLVYPLGEDEVAMEYKQAPEGRLLVPKVLSAHSKEELDALTRIGWKVQE